MYLDDLVKSNSDEAQGKKKSRKASSSFLPGRDEIGDNIHWGDTGVIDHVLQGREIQGSSFSAMQSLTDAGRAKGALKLPVVAGTRVTFAHNLGSVLSYDHVPDEGVAGTVITVRGASGDMTVHDGYVMVNWDDGAFQPVLPEHLRQAKNNKQASRVRVSFVDFSPLLDVFDQSKTAATDLIHKATKDLWSFRQDGESYVIERLFDGDGEPLKGV